MAVPRSASVKRLAALLFEGQEEETQANSAKVLDDMSTDAQSEPSDDDEPLVRLPWISKGFSRWVSEDSTQPPSVGLSRQSSLCADARSEPFEAVLPYLWWRDVQEKETVIAVARDGKAHLLVSDESDDMEAKEAPFYVVDPGGAAYYVPDGHHVDWDNLGQGPRNSSADHGCQRAAPLSGVAYSFAPLDTLTRDAWPSRTFCKIPRGAPKESVPRSPSLRRLSARLFEA